MARADAKKWFQQMPGDPSTAFITQWDAQAAVDQIYDDMVAGGTVGPAGPAGPQGVAGPQGPAGPAGLAVHVAGVLDDSNALPATVELNTLYIAGETTPVAGWPGGLSPNAGDGLYYDENGVWSVVGAIRGPEGPAGVQGPQGPQGAAGLDGDPGEPPLIRGVLDGTRPLPGTVAQGDVFIAGDTPPTAGWPGGLAGVSSGDGLQFDGTAWSNTGPLRGPQGIQGKRGLMGPGVHMLPPVADVASLPATGNTEGDLRYVVDVGDVYVWADDPANPGTFVWLDIGHLRGPEGASILIDLGAPDPADGNPGDVYIDQATGNVWGPKQAPPTDWGTTATQVLLTRTAGDNRYVKLVGDSMTGRLTITDTSGVQLWLGADDTDWSGIVFGTNSGDQRWMLAKTNTGALDLYRTAPGGAEERIVRVAQGSDFIGLFPGDVLQISDTRGGWTDIKTPGSSLRITAGGTELTVPDNLGPLSLNYQTQAADAANTLVTKGYVDGFVLLNPAGGATQTVAGNLAVRKPGDAAIQVRSDTGAAYLRMQADTTGDSFIDVSGSGGVRRWLWYFRDNNLYLFAADDAGTWGTPGTAAVRAISINRGADGSPERGRVLLGHQTADADPADTAATKGYVDGRGQSGRVDLTGITIPAGGAILWPNEPRLTITFPTPFPDDKFSIHVDCLSNTFVTAHITDVTRSGFKVNLRNHLATDVAEAAALHWSATR